MTQQQQSMWEVAKAIARREGVPVLWRGTAASLLIAVPMVGIYMPLYDALLASWAGSMGGLGPVASGITARVSACFCVAPFELLRTRLQASAAAGVSMRSTISSLVAEHHAAAALQQQAQAAAAAGPANGSAASSAALAVAAAVEAQPVRAGALLRAVPRMWTGFSATLVRDVPFSAMYWALVEPLRQAMLPRNSHWKPLQTLADRTQAAYSNSVLSKRGGGRHGSGGGSGSGSSGAPPARRVLPSQQHLHHSQLEILIANMVSGCVAGGVAAAVTTPFDVAKTRMQISTPAQQQAHAARAAAAAAPAAVAGGAGGAGGSAGAGWLGNVKVFSVLREVYHREGLEGLFTGVKPRAFRAAPACGIVISVYELLKSFLTPPE
jgi:solute carrier family 25 protein 39/40